MNPPPPPPTTPKKELQLQGPRPAPLKLSKDSVKIKKPPPHPHNLRQNPPQPNRHFQPPPQHNQPVVIYTVSPKPIHVSVDEFMSLVQRLTGPSSSPPGDISPAARLASIEKTSPSSDHKYFPPPAATTANDDDFIDSILEGIDITGQFPGILSPAPATMPPIPPGFFSPVVEEPQNFNNWQGAPSSSNVNSGFNSFMASPSAMFSTPLVSPSPSSWDFFNNFLERF
ncbi:protein MKS1 [Argentina anserina]|uniref:protein MKS1 n=1 Tax=Argentina anserina TaxID=57926 RepID=UPI00217626F4|nr:protein MKS1 [Potentilla anserina]